MCLAQSTHTPPLVLETPEGIGRVWYGGVLVVHVRIVGRVYSCESDLVGYRYVDFLLAGLWWILDVVGMVAVSCARADSCAC